MCPPGPSAAMCNALGCPEPGAPSLDWCVAHGSLVYQFHAWLLNANGPPHAGGSFDAARLLWDREAEMRLRAR